MPKGRAQGVGGPQGRGQMEVQVRREREGQAVETVGGQGGCGVKRYTHEGQMGCRGPMGVRGQVSGVRWGTGVHMGVNSRLWN